MAVHGLDHNIRYFKRFRMERELGNDLPAAVLPAGFSWWPWQPVLLEHHAEVKFQCFHDEIDATIFPSLGCRQGCLLLMTEISRRPGFIPEATWLVVGPDGPCGTVQGIRERPGVGAIQNLGVVPGCRGRGIGEALLLQALHGFCRVGLGRAVLEVTAQNDVALRLYRRLGFRCRRTLYKAVDVAATFPF
ncbi:MAG: GNAT family N-acetyltransferase [Gemmataceae bacterium]|nr:GNAT family N-acetyltransferase [Gemmataceae bacterium]MDW8265142.1 GNAT family N-acetyltransferase [Gemmataceae bacterium]